MKKVKRLVGLYTLTKKGLYFFLLFKFTELRLPWAPGGAGTKVSLCRVANGPQVARSTGSVILD